MYPRHDVPIEFNEENLRLTEPNQEALKELFDEMEFRNFAKANFHRSFSKGS